MKINVKPKPTPVFTAPGAKASNISVEQQLRRSVLACMLWEDSFYEGGEDIATRIRNLVPQVSALKVANIAIEAREIQHLRHVPLFLVRELARNQSSRHVVASTLERVIQRPDEIAEFLAIYWKEGKCPIAKSVKKGLAAAFNKFNEHQFAKYDRDGLIKLRDVMFMVHPRPIGQGTYTVKLNKKNGGTQLRHDDQLFERIAERKLTTPDTWEVELSAGADKRETFERLMVEKKLGALAFLRNLRNMEQSGVDQDLIATYASSVNLERILPFRFIAAARACPRFEGVIEEMMLRQTQKVLPGKTILVVDVSGSMFNGNVSKKSDLTRVDAAGALAILIRECAEQPVIYATAGDDRTRIHKTELVPNRRGFALSDLISRQHNLCKQLGGGGIFLTQCMDYIAAKEPRADRIIVITDEQDCDRNLSPEKANAFGTHNYIINISIEKNGIGYSKWTHINGWSEAVIDYIRESEFAQ